jgi:hypothetical protein
MSNTNPTTTWRKVSGYISGFGSSVGQFVAGTKYWTPQALFNYTAGTGTRACVISGWKVIKVNAMGNRFFSGSVGIGTTSPDANLTVQGQASFNSGSLANPGIAARGDLNTGIYFPAADTIGFVEGGVEAMRLDASGRLGIGTTAPGALLHVQGAVSASSYTANGNVVLHAGNAASFATTAVTAGSGLTGGGTVGSLTVNVGAGDGISVAADSVAVDSTVLRTTGNQDISGIKTFSTPSGQTFNGASGNIGLTVFNASAGDAMMTFHVGGDYAFYFGLGGAENDLVMTGWSFGSTRARILHSSNYTSWAPSLTGTGASGTWGISITGNAGTATTFSTGRTNYKGVTDAAVAGQLMWKHYGNSHTIIDASNGTAPDGTSINNTNAAVAWSSTYPTLVGWNGSSTYGVRVDSARVADNISAHTINQNLGTGNSPTFAGLTVNGQLAMADNVISRPRFTDYAETYTTPAISSNTLTLNLENGNVFRVTRNANISTLTISNPAGTGNACSFTLIFDANGTSYTITWPTAVKWPGGTAPTITTTNGRSDMFVFYTNNAGTTWYAMTAAQNFVTT